MSHPREGPASPWVESETVDLSTVPSSHGKAAIGLQPLRRGSSPPNAEVISSPKKQRSSSAEPLACSQGTGVLRWYQIPLSSTRKLVSGIFSNRFQASLQEYYQLRELKRMKVGQPFHCPAPVPRQGQPHEGAWAPDKTSNNLQMAGPQKTMPALPQEEEVGATTRIPLPTLKHSLTDHPLHRGLLRSNQQLCSPLSAPVHNLPKKPKIQPSGDIFPADWSPPPVEFLNPKIPQASQEAPVQTGVGVTGPRGLRSLAHPQPRERKQKSLDSDPEEVLASLKELFGNMASPTQHAASPVLSPGGPGGYVNNLDYLLQEKREQALEQEQEQVLLQDCLNLNNLELDEAEVTLMPEHRMIVEKFSVSQQVIPQVHPGETVFLPRRHPRPCFLDCSHLKPCSHLERMFLSSSPVQQLSFLHRGLLSNLYLHRPDCPVPVFQWLFQLLTWPPETSSEAFGLLWDLSVDRLFRPPGEVDIGVWCPTVQEIIEVFHSLGAQSSTLDPLGSHRRGESKNEANLSWEEQQPTPQEMALDISLSHICKYLMLCVLAQPEAYTDDNLLGLIELLCQSGLDTGLRLLPKTDLQQLLLVLLENIQEWPRKLQELCRALSCVSHHHHNLLALVQCFPDLTARSRQLRSQLSLVVIAQMLGQQETLPLWQEKMQLSLLSRLLSLMRPSSLRQHLGTSSGTLSPCQEQQPKAIAELDHKVCYLSHSLLTLAGVVVSSQDITPDQWRELQLLCVQLDRHISTHIRESPQAMHRTKLKDLATQTYIRWQELLAHCQPQVEYFRPWKGI